jgi:hypothetical protein
MLTFLTTAKSQLQANNYFNYCLNTNINDIIINISLPSPPLSHLHSHHNKLTTDNICFIPVNKTLSSADGVAV